MKFKMKKKMVIYLNHTYLKFKRFRACFTFEFA